MNRIVQIVGLTCLSSIVCCGNSSTRPRADGSVDRPGAHDARAEAAVIDGNGGVSATEPCNDGTGATDCCPVGTTGGGVCSGHTSTCYSRCAFPDDAATQGTRSGFSCAQGVWLAGHGLFPCSRS